MKISILTAIELHNSDFENTIAHNSIFFNNEIPSMVILARLNIHKNIIYCRVELDLNSP